MNDAIVIVIEKQRTCKLYMQVDYGEDEAHAM